MDIAKEYAISNRKFTRAAQTLLGICSGLTADNQINDLEIIYLRTWLSDNREITDTWPGNAIARRIDEIMADGVITDEERKSLLATLREVSGNDFQETGSATANSPALPIDPDTNISFNETVFCFTGQFIYGTRSACQQVIEQRGARSHDSVTAKIDYLVIGSMVSEAWANTTYGRKIEAAIKHREKHGKPLIISEQQWVKALENLC